MERGARTRSQGKQRQVATLHLAPSCTWRSCYLLPLQTLHRPPAQVQLHLPPPPSPATCRPPALVTVYPAKNPIFRGRRQLWLWGGQEELGESHTLGITVGEHDGWESWLGEGWLVEESGGVARYGRVRWRVLRPEPSTVDVGVVTRGSLPSSREAFHPSTSTAAAAAACPGKASGDILRQYSQPTITGSRIICIHHRIAGFCHR